MAAPQQNNEKRGVRSSKIWLRLKNPKTFFSPKSPTRHIYPNKIRHNFLMGFVAFEVKFDFSVRFGWNTYIYIYLMLSLYQKPKTSQDWSIANQRGLVRRMQPYESVIITSRSLGNELEKDLHVKHHAHHEPRSMTTGYVFLRN